MYLLHLYLFLYSHQVGGVCACVCVSVCACACVCVRSTCVCVCVREAGGQRKISTPHLRSKIKLNIARGQRDIVYPNQLAHTTKQHENNMITIRTYQTLGLHSMRPLASALCDSWFPGRLADCVLWISIIVLKGQQQG